MSTVTTESIQTVLGLLSAKEAGNGEAAAGLLAGYLADVRLQGRDDSTGWMQLAVTALQVAFDVIGDVASDEGISIEELLNQLRLVNLRIS